MLTLALLVLLVLPLSLAITAAVVNAGEIAERAKSLEQLPPAVAARPGWPGCRSSARRRCSCGTRSPRPASTACWRGSRRMPARSPGGVVAQASGFGFILLECVLALAFSALLYMRGEAAARLVQRIGARLAGPRGANAVLLATRAIRGVALGVGGTAVVQSVLTGIGLSLAGVPFAALLSGLAFVLCLVQVGTVPVLLPAVIWVFWTGDTGWGSFLLVWSIIIGTADNVLRPMLIQRGVDLPFWLVFTGVVGGLLAFGLVGLFIGPVVLAVASMLLTNWLADGDTDYHVAAGARCARADADPLAARAAGAPAGGADRRSDRHAARRRRSVDALRRPRSAGCAAHRAGTRHLAPMRSAWPGRHVRSKR